MTTPHLDDEALSAAFDGEATAEEQAHLDQCARCRNGVAGLDQVVRAVGSPVPPRPASEVAAAISRATAAATGEPPGEASPARSGRESEGRPRKAPGWWLGAAGGVAAAMVIAVGMVALVRGAGSRNQSSTSALASATTAVPGASARPRNGAVSPTVGTDLGDQSDPAALARQLRAGLAAASAAASAAAPGTGPAATAGGSPPASALCSAQGVAAAGLAVESAPLVVFSGSVRWQGEPAVVLVYSAAGRLAGVVMRAADCSRLVVVPL